MGAYKTLTSRKNSKAIEYNEVISIYWDTHQQGERKVHDTQEYFGELDFLNKHSLN